MRNLISQTKVYNTSPVSQFCVLGYSVPFRLDRTGKGGGIWTCRMLSKFTFEKASEAFAIENNLCKVKQLLVCSYNPNLWNIPVHLNAIEKVIDFNSKKKLIAGDFNVQVSDIKLDTFCSYGIWKA